MRDNYWTRQQGRRRFIGTAGAAGLGAAALALTGCGDDEGDGGTQLATPTPIAAQPTVDPYKDAKKGGVMKVDINNDPPTIDPYGNVSVATKNIANYVYSRLMRYKTGPEYTRDAGNVRPTGDLTDGLENSPDGLKWTFKLRNNIKFHNIAPVNGRPVTTEDIKFSWGRATDAKNGNRTQLAFIDKVEFPDASTVTFTLKEPNAAFTDVIADGSLLYIQPKEADGGFNPALQMIGSGPWIFESYQRSVAFKFKKNPEWHITGFPLMDAVESAIIPDYANRLAQFKSGATDVTGINSNDLVEMKKAVPDVQFGPDTSVGQSTYWFDSDPNSPWNKDPRVRQALSVCLDRDALTDLGFNVKGLNAAGIATSIQYNNIIPISIKRWWLDPVGKDAGDTAKFFKYDPAESRKLLSAAGYPDGISTIYSYTGNGYGVEYTSIAEASIQMLNQGGFKTQTDVQDYATKYITQTFIGNFKGINFGLETSFPEGSGYVLRLYTPEDPNNHGRINVPEMAALAKKQQSELDEVKRREIFWDIQRKNAQNMYYVPGQAGAGTRWIAYQGNLRNSINHFSQGYGTATERAPFRWRA